MSGKQLKTLLTKSDWEVVSGARVVMMCGLPGSGKSTIAKQLAKELGAVYLSSDVIRLSEVFKDEVKYLKSDDDYVKTRELIYSLMHRRMLDNYNMGQRVVLDATYLGPQRETVLELLISQELADDSVVVVVRTSTPAVVKRIEALGRQVTGRKVVDGWKQAYDWFVNEIQAGRVRYPDEVLDGVRVVEVRND